MSNQVFDINFQLGNERASAEVTEPLARQNYFYASLLQSDGLAPDTFMGFAERFSQLTTELYGGSTVRFVLDRAQPNLTIDCDELRNALDAQPGDSIATPANPDIAKEVLKHATAAEVIIKPTHDLLGMPNTFAMASWTSHAGKLMEFYAQGCSSPEGSEFIEELYARMFPELVLRRGVKVALGMSAVRELRMEALGPDAFRQEQRVRFDYNSAITGHPNSAYYLGDSPASRVQNTPLFNFLKKIFGTD